MLSLSDAELQIILSLAEPLDPTVRDPFLRAIASQLATRKPEEIGPGSVSRIARALQREFLRAARHPVSRSRAWFYAQIHQIAGTLMMVRSPRVWSCSRMALTSSTQASTASRLGNS